MDTRAAPIEQVRQAIDRLVDAQRSTCLWFSPRGYQPGSDEERLAARRSIERHGDRVAFIEARELRDWLLRVASET